MHWHLDQKEHCQKLWPTDPCKLSTKQWRPDQQTHCTKHWDLHCKTTDEGQRKTNTHKKQWRGREQSPHGHELFIDALPVAVYSNGGVALVPEWLWRVHLLEQAQPAQVLKTLLPEDRQWASSWILWPGWTVTSLNHTFNNYHIKDRQDTNTHNNYGHWRIKYSGFSWNNLVSMAAGQQQTSNILITK